MYIYKYIYIYIYIYIYNNKMKYIYSYLIEGTDGYNIQLFSDVYAIL